MVSNIKKIETLLKQHNFFEGLNEEYIDLIAGCGSNVRINAGNYLFKEGQEANTFYIVRHGNIALEISHPVRGPLTIDTVSEGEVLGWSWLYPPYRWFLDARAVELVRAIAIDGKCLRDRCEEDPELGYALMKRFSSIIADRLQETRLRLLDLYSVSK